MKRTFKYIIGITCSLAAAFSCARIQEQDVPEVEQVEKFQMTFSAVIDDGDQTKTVLGGEMGDQYRKVLWQHNDTIRIIHSGAWYEYMNSKFTNVEEGESEVASFVGEVYEYDANYYAFYPSSDNIYYYDYCNIRFNLPSSQSYRRNSFDRNSMPMVAKAAKGETFRFQSLCGVLAINLTGTETIKSMSFTGYDASGKPMPVAGSFIINMNYESYPEMCYENMDMIVSSTISLDCGEGVTLDPSTPTAFYIVLPVATYHSFAISVATTDGKIMLKQGTNPLTIKRANVTKAGSLVFVEEVAFDLCKEGNANSYIVTEPGIYSFDATVIGNGGYGFVEGINFHTKTPFISPAKAELLWEDRTGVVSNVTFDGRNITFLASGAEGNALIAAKDESGTILWSWHIWVTDQPQEQVYVNYTGTYPMMDRNLGAIRTDRGVDNDWRDANGMMYQWGRKDPMAYTKQPGYEVYFKSFTSESRRVSLEGAIQNPTVHYGAGYYQWNETPVDSLWSTTQKTIYDPCPMGYRVPTTDVFRSFTSNEYSDWSQAEYWNMAGEFLNGADFYYDGGNSTYFPATSYINTDGWQQWGNDRSYLWTSESPNKDYGYSFNFYYYSYISSQITYRSQSNRSDGNNIRCMKDDGYENTLRPMVKLLAVKDQYSEGATVEAAVTAEGNAPVTEYGIVWGTSKDLTLDNASYQAIGQGVGEFSYEITGLANATKYYVCAYAINDYGVTYSNVKSFYTPYEGNVFDLSIGGTANCYIVPLVYAEYAFNATVKGNSTESVGDIAYAEVLWEADLGPYMTFYYSLNVGDIITDVVLKDGLIHFTLPFEPKSGNALIAVKDANGTILWSWHIWVVDFDDEDNSIKLHNGAVIMDRNLGAVGVYPGSVESYGFFYQWGRKDPFIVPGYMTTAPENAISYEYYDYYNNNIEYSVAHPTVVYNDATWGDVDNLWGVDKTMYDPCPEGWKVSESEIWSGLYRAENSQSGYFEVASQYASPRLYFPAPGYTTGDDYVQDNTGAGDIWTSRQYHYVHAWVWNNDVQTLGGRSTDYLCGVRCMKERTNTSGDNEGYDEDDKYEW